MKPIEIAVTEFAQPNIRLGDIDERSNSGSVFAELGVEWHKIIQRERSAEFKSYISEHPLDWSFETSARDDLSIKLRGRADGIYTDDDGVLVIEDIKSSGQMPRLEEQLTSDFRHPYWLQVKVYAWIYRRVTGAGDIKLRLQVISSSGRSRRTFDLMYDDTEHDAWMSQRLAWVKESITKSREFLDSRRQRAETLKFPFKNLRGGQETLLKRVESALKKGERLLIQAPTGIGKTASVMFPAIRLAMRQKRQYFHITAKNSQLHECERFLRRIESRRKGRSKISALIMTSKQKICPQEKIVCTPEACPLAKGHFDRCHENKVIDKLRERGVVHRKILKEFSETYQVCPYELQKQLLPWVDVACGDYHYALSPHDSFREGSNQPFIEGREPLLTIDEAHNLADRSLDWYATSVQPIPATTLNALDPNVRKAARAINSWLKEQLDLLESPIGRISVSASEYLEKILADWNRTMPFYLEDLPRFIPVAEDPLVQNWFSWLEFRAILQNPLDLFFVVKGQDSLRIHCACAAPMLHSQFSKYRGVVAFSATLKPFDYHAGMIGFSLGEWGCEELPTSFPPENRKIIMIPQVSTRYRARSRQVPRINEVVRRVVELKFGNYIVFFPSFEFLESTFAEFDCPAGFRAAAQPRQQGHRWLSDICEDLEKSRGVIVFAVQGGVLSEGVDLPGETLIGAFIVGPAIPTVSQEREQRKEILDQLFGEGRGQDMAYTHPAMAKSVQSAGRVIRSPEDRGIMIFMDDRFLKPEFARSLPIDWTSDGGTPDTLVSRSIINDIGAFWRNGARVSDEQPH